MTRIWNSTQNTLFCSNANKYYSNVANIMAFFHGITATDMIEVEGSNSTPIFTNAVINRDINKAKEQKRKLVVAVEESE